MNASSVDIDPSWKSVLAQEFEASYFDQLKAYLIEHKNQGQVIYPSGKLIFNAFNLTPFDQVKVVILGQDPYHNPGEAMGLCFSVPKGVRVPPSLKNIFKEQVQDLQVTLPDHGDLTAWAKQGVLLLNAMLTVEHKQAGSHKSIGWQKFTNAVIQEISNQKKGIVFLLWGNFAKSKKQFIDDNKHLVLESTHPSPLAGKSFFGNHHFSKTNAYLASRGKAEINWQL